MHNPAQDEEYEQRIQAIQANINKYQTQLLSAEAAKATMDNIDCIKSQLNNEYAALRQARLDRKQQFADLYAALPSLRRERQKDILTRQKQFEDDMAFKKATKNRTNALFDTCVALEKNLRSLLAVDREVEKTEASEYNEQHSSESTQQQQEQQQDYAIQVVNKSTLDEDMDTSVLLIPLDIMEQFWAIGIAAPVMLSEVEQTLAKIGKRKEELERQ